MFLKSRTVLISTQNLRESSVEKPSRMFFKNVNPKINEQIEWRILITIKNEGIEPKLNKKIIADNKINKEIKLRILKSTTNVPYPKDNNK